MLPLASALFLGAVLGLRFNVFVLIPASLVAAGTTFATSFAAGDSFVAALSFAISSVIVLQLGYFAAIIRSRPDDVTGASNSATGHLPGGAQAV